MPPEPHDARRKHDAPASDSAAGSEFDRTASLFPARPEGKHDEPGAVDGAENAETQVVADKEESSTQSLNRDRPPRVQYPPAGHPTPPVQGLGSSHAEQSLQDLPSAEWNVAMDLFLRFEQAWRSGADEPDLDGYLHDAGALRPRMLVPLVLSEIEARRDRGQKVRVTRYLEHYGDDIGVNRAVDLVIRDYEDRRRRDPALAARAYLAELNAYPQLRNLVEQQLAAAGPDEADTIERERPPALTPAPGSGSTRTGSVRTSSPKPPRPPRKPGEPDLPSKFRVIEKLGQGGMGEVWLVEHESLSRRVVKVILSSHAGFAESRVRMIREARALDRIKHPNAVIVHDVQAHPVPYIEMEYVAGQSLDKRLQRGVAMPLDWIDRVLDQICDVLQAAHQTWKIVHRDLKPANMMLARDEATGAEVLKVLDFGLAKFLDIQDEEESDGMLTNMGQTLGTFAYMSPEQAMNPAEVRSASDIYSVGVILYELLTGYRPFMAPTSHALVYKIINESAPPFREKNPEVEVPEGVEALVLRCLEKDPAKRPSAHELAEEFHRLVQPPPPPPPPPAPVVAAAPPASRLASWGVGILTLVLASIGVGWFFQVPRIVPPPPHWTAARSLPADVPGPPLVKVGTHLYHRALERTLDDETVLVLLIEPRGKAGTEAGPFYMMRDKVWEGLFARFARAHPDLVPAPPQASDDPRRPVMNVTGYQAQAFAEWLGGKGYGFLPTTWQWDQAAGRNLEHARDGPYRNDPKYAPGDWSDIAVGGLKLPWPVGQAQRDVSPYGCRDMSGNGLEWTRLPPNQPRDFMTVLRSQTFQETEPYQFLKFTDDYYREEFHKAGFGTSFRVVLEVKPGP